MTTSIPRALTATEAAIVDMTGLMADLGKKVIHIGGRASTEQLYGMARFEAGQGVLDAGCGVGTTAIEIASRFGCHVTAIDIAPTMVEQARANVRAAGLEDRVLVEQADVLDLPLPDDAFDRVVVEAVVMFVDREQAVRELVRVCKPGGHVIDHEAFFGTQPPADVVDICHRELLPGIAFQEPEEWAELYRAAGLTGIDYVSREARFWSPVHMLRDEGAATFARMVARMLTRPQLLRRMARLTPRVRKVEPYVSYLVLSGRKPRQAADQKTERRADPLSAESARTS